jgi:nucleoside-diphosphate-sugar epimerase
MEVAALASEVFGRVTDQAVMLTRDKCNELFESWVCDSESARRELGWKPTVSFEDGARRTADFYKRERWL